jgi:hypothetical protein
VSLGFLDSVREETQQGDVLDGSLLRTLGEGMPAWIADAEDGTFKEVHHALLLVQVSLVRQVVECEDRVVTREHRSDQRCTVEIVAA